jgi:hypothetical protein
MNKFEKAIERLEDDIKSADEWEDIEHLGLAIQALEKQLNGGWIPVTEKLPERGIPVLVSDKQGNVCVRAITCEIKGRKYWSQDKYDILAWQPLPKPYKEVEE